MLGSGCVSRVTWRHSSFDQRVVMPLTLRPRHRMSLFPGSVMLLSLIAALGGAFGCAPGEEPTVVIDPVDTTRITLAIGAKGTVSGVEISLLGIDEDSRCPAELTCIWQGNVKARVHVRASGGAVTPLTLNTALQPRTAVVGVRQVRIDLVAPLTRANGPAIVPSSYRVTFRVEPAQ